MEVYSLNGKIIDEGKADIKWYIDIDNGTIQNIDGMYVVFEDANDSDIKLSSKKEIVGIINLRMEVGIQKRQMDASLDIMSK